MGIAKDSIESLKLKAKSSAFPLTGIPIFLTGPNFPSIILAKNTSNPPS